MADKTNNIKTKLAFDGEAEYKKNCAEITNNLKLQSSALKLVTAQYADNGQSVDALRAKQGVLKNTLEQQRQKVVETEKALSAMKIAQGENSAGTVRMETALNRAKAEMASTENQIKKLDSELNNAGKSSSNFGDNIKSATSKIGGGLATGVKLAGGAIVGMAGATVAASAGIGKMVSSASENADELQRLSDTTGMSAEKLQEMRYVGSAVGVSLDTMTGAQSKLIKSMSAAQSGTGTQAEAYRKLGVSITDGSGNLRDSNTVFQEAITKLGNMKNPTEQSAVAMQIFGKSAMQLNPLIRAGGDSIKQMTDEAHKNGAIMSNESVSALDSFGDSVDALKLSAKGMAGTFAVSVLPMLNGLVSLFGNLSASLNSALKTGDFSKFGDVLSSGVSDAVEKLSGMVEKAVPVAEKVVDGIIGALVKAIPTLLPTLTNGVVQLLNAVIKILEDNGPMLINAGVQALVTIIKGLSQALPNLMSAAISMVVTLASSLSQQLPTLIPVAVNAIITIVNGLIENLPKLINAAIQIIVSLVQGIVNALPQLIDEVPKIIMGIIQGIVGALPQLIKAAPQIIVSIIMGIIKAIPQLITYAPQIISAIISGLIQAIPQLLAMGPQMLKELSDGLAKQNWGEIGGNIIKGLVDGFKNAGKWIKDGVKNAGDSLVKGFKEFFNIHSPARLPDLVDGVGGNIGKGIANGISNVDFMSGVPAMIFNAKSKISSAMSGITANINADVSSNSGKTVVQNFYGDIHAATAGDKQLTLQQMQFAAP